jgi:hypothetical protein
MSAIGHRPSVFRHSGDPVKAGQIGRGRAADFRRQVKVGSGLVRILPTDKYRKSLKNNGAAGKD